MVVNDNACKPDKHGALESIASKPAPTRDRFQGQKKALRTRPLSWASHNNNLRLYRFTASQNN
ncbi:UNVERIFIED_ORG: hypothetical protein OKW15_000504 [Pseudomonas reinekei]|nr:hypothetical protein [Pseudomonas reinekei]